MRTSSLNHLALLVPSVEVSAEVLTSRGLACGRPQVFESEGTKEIYIGSYAQQSGLLLLVEPIAEGPYKKALMKRGPGLHHIAIDVLNIENFLSRAQRLGWNLHPESDHTMEYQTAWLFLKGIPTLLEVQQKTELSKKPLQISQIELPIEKEKLILFHGIGLNHVIPESKELYLTIDEQRMSFTQMNHS